MTQKKGKQMFQDLSDDNQDYNEGDDNGYDSNNEQDEQNMEMSQDVPDEKDRIILKQKQMIETMQNEFAATLDSLHAQWREFVEESAHVQEDMLERIKELKAELNQVKKKNARAVGGSAAVKSSLYNVGPKHPRKLAQNDVRRSTTARK